MRQPIANTTHYANGVTLLDKQFDEIFHHERGPGALPTRRKEVDSPVKAIIVPHAPYLLAGPCAAWAYKALGEERQDTDLYIIIAQAQTDTATGVSMETYSMPYGEVRVDQHLARALVEKGHIQVNDGAHQKESIIEIQLPFIQLINKNRLEKIKILPLLVGDSVDIPTLAVDIKETLLEQKKTANFIFVSNFTSYGRNFKYVPFTNDIDENITKLDKRIVDTIQVYDKEAFDQLIQETLVPLSGYFALKLFFYLFSPQKILFEHYYLSGDMNGNYLNTISYSAITLR